MSDGIVGPQCWQIRVDADGVVRGIENTSVPVEGATVVTEEIYFEAAARIDRVKLVGGSLVDLPTADVEI